MWRAAALPCSRRRRGLLVVPCLAGLLAAFVVTPSPAAQKPESAKPKLWAMSVSATKAPTKSVSQLQSLRRRGVEALVVNAAALSPDALSRLADRAAHAGLRVIAARGSLRPGACPSANGPLSTCAVIAQTPREAASLAEADFARRWSNDRARAQRAAGARTCPGPERAAGSDHAKARVGRAIGEPVEHARGQRRGIDDQCLDTAAPERLQLRDALGRRLRRAHAHRPELGLRGFRFLCGGAGCDDEGCQQSGEARDHEQAPTATAARDAALSTLHALLFVGWGVYRYLARLCFITRAGDGGGVMSAESALP